MRLVDADNLKNKLEYGLLCNIPVDSNDSESEKLNTWIQEVIDKQPTVTPQEPRWIPVKERFPEENDGYLVTVKRGYVTTALWCGNAEYWNEVTAWMPLPKPYNEVEE